jgi:hypothetical protein
MSLFYLRLFPTQGDIPVVPNNMQAFITPPLERHGEMNKMEKCWGNTSVAVLASAWYS